MSGMYYHDKCGKCHDMDEYISNIKKEVKKVNEKAKLKLQWLTEIEKRKDKGGNNNE